MLVPAATLESRFLRLLGLYQPTVEYLNQLPEIASRRWQEREKTIQQDSRALNIRLAEQKRLNSTAIKAKLTGELSTEDFDSLKTEITAETERIENAIRALESEAKQLEEMTKQAVLEQVSLSATWKAIPDGLVWSEESAFFNSKNKTFIDGFSQILPGISTPQEEAEKLIDKFGVPDGI